MVHTISENEYTPTHDKDREKTEIVLKEGAWARAEQVQLQLFVQAKDYLRLSIPIYRIIE